jgi:hypothetical protein
MFSYQQKYETDMFARNIHSLHLWTQHVKIAR